MTLSIITINYNNKDGLKDTLKSVRVQTQQSFQHIIVDGGSSDGSIDTINDNIHQDTKWISEPDHGIYDAMNKGIDMATGDYCLFLNSGDSLFSESVVEEMLPLLDGTDFIYGNTHYSDGKVRLSKNEPDVFSYLFQSCYCHQSMFIKTSILKEHHYDASLKIVADWKLYLQTMILGVATYKAIDINVSLYDANGISSINKNLYDTERAEVLRDLFPPRMLKDYDWMVLGRSIEDKLYIEIKHSVLHKIIYSINVLLIKFMTLFSRNSSWAKKYPYRLN